jgi:16S rRNA processing protein RimM
LNKKDCFKLGYISKTHGLKGEIALITEAGASSFIKKNDCVFFELNNQLVPFFVLSVSKKADRLVLKLDEVNSIEQAALLKSASVYLPKPANITPLEKTTQHSTLNTQHLKPNTQHNFHELVGYTITDQRYGPIGTLEAILEYPLQNILQIRNSDKREILIPAREEFITGLNADTRTLEMSTPEGLIEVYLK